MKGHMQDGKFHPHTEKKGVRKSRDQTAKTEGVRMKRFTEREQEIIKDGVGAFKIGAGKGFTKRFDPIFLKVALLRLQSGLEKYYVTEKINENTIRIGSANTTHIDITVEQKEANK